MKIKYLYTCLFLNNLTTSKVGLPEGNNPNALILREFTIVTVIHKKKKILVTY